MTGFRLTAVGVVLAVISATAFASHTEGWIMCDARFYKEKGLNGQSFILETGNQTWDGQSQLVWGVPDISSPELGNVTNIYMDNTTWNFRRSIHSFEFRCLTQADPPFNRFKAQLRIFNNKFSVYRDRKGVVNPLWLEQRYNLEDFSPSLAMCVRHELDKAFQKSVNAAVITLNYDNWGPDNWPTDNKRRRFTRRRIMK